MKLCDTCIYRNNVEQLKPCIIYRDNCEYYEKEREDMTDDLISRQAVKDKYRERLVNNLKDDDRGIDLSKYAEEPHKAFCEFMDSIPPINPQEPKTGHWIANAPQYDMLNPQYICSECGNAHTRTTPYCEMCGARMVEPQESEIHCNCTDAEIAKSFIEDVEAVKDLLPQERSNKK